MTLLATSRSRTLVLAAFSIVICLVAAFLIHDHLFPVQPAFVIADTFAVPQKAALSTPHPGTTPVLVELFTSEGCSSCPPADALLAHLQQDQPVPAADILALEEHVDYWDSLGWHDRFSSHAITDRQSTYAKRLRLDDNYTPQMIVDGTDQFVGNDSATALRAIAQAARSPKLALTLAPLAADGNHITGAVSLANPPAPLPSADIVAALVEPMASTQVLHGENGGRTLHHVSVVRDLHRIGSLADATASPLKFSLASPNDASGLRLIVFVQRTGQGAILGASSSPLPTTPATPTSLTAAR